MRDRSITPTNLLDWPRCKGLLPDQRLILLWLWACPYLSCAGAGLVPLAPAGATLGLDQDALAGGLKSLQAAGLVELDEKTGEIFIKDWFRFHKFSGPVAAKSLDAALKKIESGRVLKAVLDAKAKVIHSQKDNLPKKQSNPIKSTTYLPTPTSTSTSTLPPPTMDARAGASAPAAAAPGGGGRFEEKMKAASLAVGVDSGAASRAARAAAGAQHGQQGLLLALLAQGVPAWVKDPGAWLVSQAKKAAAGELEDTPQASPKGPALPSFKTFFLQAKAEAGGVPRWEIGLVKSMLEIPGEEFEARQGELMKSWVGFRGENLENPAQGDWPAEFAKHWEASAGAQQPV